MVFGGSLLGEFAEVQEVMRGGGFLQSVNAWVLPDQSFP